MKLEFVNRTEEESRKKVLFYGHAGHGKSTAAANYCVQHGLKPVIIDVDNTNYTMVEDDKFKTHKLLNVEGEIGVKLYRNLMNVIQELNIMTDIDTIIIDGWSSLLDLLLDPNKTGWTRFNTRDMFISNIFNKLITGNKHLIFIGQINMRVIITDEKEPNKWIVKIDSIVNEKYFCQLINDKYKVTTEKHRGIQ